jgi:hypothetical protein
VIYDELSGHHERFLRLAAARSPRIYLASDYLHHLVSQPDCSLSYPGGLRVVADLSHTTHGLIGAILRITGPGSRRCVYRIALAGYDFAGCDAHVSVYMAEWPD